MMTNDSIERSAGASAIASYILPLLTITQPASPVGRVIADWCWDYEQTLGFSFADTLSKRKKNKRRRTSHRYGKPLSAKAWEKLKTRISAIATARQDFTLSYDVSRVAQLIGLDELDTKIFTVIALADYDFSFETFLDRIARTRSMENAGIIATMIAENPVAVRRCLDQGNLTKLRLIDGFVETAGEYNLFVPSRVMKAIRTITTDHKQAERYLMGRQLQAKLAPNDFMHIDRDVHFAVRLLRGATVANTSGVNILLYGPPGVGKTELAATIAAEAGVDLFSVGEDDGDGYEPNRSGRLHDLCVADRLANRRSATALLFDEMEDVLAGGSSFGRGRNRTLRAGSKLHFNRILERNKVPVIWTSNSIDDFDKAVLRRMQFVIQMNVPPAHMRERHWREMNDRYGIRVGEPDARALSKTFDLAPSFANMAARSISIAGQDKTDTSTAPSVVDDLAFVLNGLARATGHRENQSRFSTVNSFTLDLIQADTDLSFLKESLSGKTAPRDVSMCLYGPPGTGKSAFARQVADWCRLDPMEKRASDLLSPWVGETEQLIAAAFEEAEKDERVLIIDEAESMFWNRSGSVKSWETSMVNEFLVNLERARVPVICTTNHLNKVDPAALRRFTWKINLNFLSPAQTILAFRQFFDVDVGFEHVARLRVTPGDFAVVKKQLRMTPHPVSVMDLCALLETEAAIKNQGARPIGF